MAYQDAERRLPPGHDLDLILMGKSGHGKSTTGNSILGRRQFVAVGGADAITKRSLVGFTEVDGRKLKVVDIPGLCDTSAHTKQAKTDIVVKAVRKGISQFPQGFSALLLVVSYTARMTEEEKEAIQTLKLIFGKDILKKHTVCIFTHGDSFKMDNGDDADFETWVKQQPGYKDLLDECGLYVLFDNMTRDPREKKAQLVNLVSKIDSINERQTRYTADKFKTAGELLLNLEKYSQENGLIKDDLNKIMHGPPAERFDNLNKLKLRISNLKEALSKDKNEQFVNMMRELDGMTVTITSLEGMLLQQERDKVERERLVKEMENMKLEAEEMRRREEQRRQDDELKRLETEKKIRELERQINERVDKAESKFDEKREGHPLMDLITHALKGFIEVGLPLLIGFFTDTSDTSIPQIGTTSGPTITEVSSESEDD